MGRETPNAARLSGPLPLLALGVLVSFIALAMPGVEPWYLGPVSAVATLLQAVPFAAAYLLAAMGWGTRLDDLWKGARGSAALQMSAGLAVMLVLSHLMGVAGLLRTGTSGLVLAWLPIAIGILLLVMSLVRAGGRDSGAGDRAADSYVMLAAAPALGVLLLAACVPPGMLWASEARGFDVLSYHLQLPREWLAAGRIVPLEHNAYSWLPSYMEAAYTHLGAMASFVARDPFTQGEGVATVASQLLHAMIAVAGAVCIGAVVSTILRKQGEQPEQRRFASSLAAVLFLTTPWVIVTGSLAYNEMAVCLFLAAAVVVCEAESLTAVRRGVLVGLLVGAACCAKPTALFMVGVPVGVLMLIRLARGEWVRAFGAAAAVGLIMLAPWLARNAIASGNPVFPYFASVFGDGHWTGLEVARWGVGHHESAGLLTRFFLLFSDRGFGHELWGPLAGLGGSTALVLVFIRRAHIAAAVVLLLLAVQVSLWLGIGHLQSRFLLPTVVVLVIPIAFAVSLALSRWPRSAMVLVGLAIAAAACAPPLIMLRETRRAPGSLVVAGIPLVTGESLARMEPMEQESRQRLEADLAPQQFINLGLAGPVRRLYLLGDSTPFYFDVPVLYHTTWDPSPLGSLLRVDRSLAEAVRRLAAPEPDGFGVSHILINFSELRRLHADGWYDPDATVADAEALIERYGRVIREWQLGDAPRIVLIEIVGSSSSKDHPTLPSGGTAGQRHPLSETSR